MAQRSEKEMPFLDHLEELRFRLFWVAGAIVVGLGVGLTIVFAVPQVMDFLTSPITPLLKMSPDGSPGQLMATSVTGPFKFLMNVGLWIGLVLSLPVIVYHVWAFLSPGLLAHERKIMMPVLGAGLILFLLGVAFAFKLALPISMGFLLEIANKNFNAQPTVEAYFELLVTMCLAFGLMFELPIVVLALTWLGIVTPQFLSKYRRHAIVILLIACAFFTPPDLGSLGIMFAPVYLLYEGSVLLSYVIVRKKQKAESIGDGA